MDNRIASVARLIAGLEGPWQPVDVAAANDSVIRLAKLQGEFPWHTHDEDELFLCWDGEFTVEMEGADPVTLRRGDVFVVPAGVSHRPVAESEAHTLMIERPETLQYGN